jgi:hypothetical protein
MGGFLGAKRRRLGRPPCKLLGRPGPGRKISHNLMRTVWLGAGPEACWESAQQKAAGGLADPLGGLGQKSHKCAGSQLLRRSGRPNPNSFQGQY